MVTARDLQEPQNHINATSGVHGITGSFVGSSDTQTLTNKTISGTANTLTNIAQSSVAGLVDDLALKATAANPIFTGTITMPSGSITSTMLADLTVATADIADSAITTVKINDSAITSAKIADDTIVNGDINSTANIAWSKLAADTNNIYTNPIGMISPFAGSTAPTGWLMCNGQAVSRTTYSALFSLIGTTYGTGDNTTTFNIPDLMGRTPIGVGSGSGLSTRLLGDKVGAESLPAHVHTIDHDHASATTNTEPNHVHTYSERASNTGDSTSTAPAWDSSSDTVDGGTFYAGNPAGAHSHTLDLPNYTGNSGSTGTGNHGVMQPSLALNYIIKY
jgi:microcystin-dependent protein